MNEQAPRTTGPREAIPDTEQRQKTLAVRIDEDMHAQLRFIAQLNDRNVTEEIRAAIQDRIAAAQTDPALIERADQVRQEIEREAAARSAAIAGFLGKPAVAGAVDATAVESTGGRRGSRPASE
ncbi:hypothetical protein [Nocardioides pyridinolyticus]